MSPTHTVNVKKICMSHTNTVNVTAIWTSPTDTDLQQKSRLDLRTQQGFVQHDSSSPLYQEENKINKQQNARGGDSDVGDASFKPGLKGGQAEKVAPALGNARVLQDKQIREQRVAAAEIGGPLGAEAKRARSSVPIPR